MASKKKTRATKADPTKEKQPNKVRLHKAIADAGVASRREAERLIEAGQVRVNGNVVRTLPAWVDPYTEEIQIDGRPVPRPSRHQPTYLMVYKPRGVICTNRDPEGRRRVIDLVPHPERLYCVGRLDADSTGLVLLTNDGELTERLTHPRYEIPKTYRVMIRGRLETEDLENLKKGIWLSERRKGGGVKVKASQVRIVSRHTDRSEIEVTLREGRNREIRRMLVRLGHPVKKLQRVAMGPVKLKGVGPGQWRALSRSEVASLRRAARRAEEKGA
jgi:pseudouridine synthase